jgi:hypothetical protein
VIQIGVGLKVMRIRKRFRVLVLAAAAATIVVPVSLSLTLDQGGSRLGTPVVNVASTYRSVVVPASISSSAPVLVVPIQLPASSPDGIPDAAQLFLVGTLLVGAAAAVRKSS